MIDRRLPTCRLLAVGSNPAYTPQLRGGGVTLSLQGQKHNSVKFIHNCSGVHRSCTYGTYDKGLFKKRRDSLSTKDTIRDHFPIVITTFEERIKAFDHVKLYVICLFFSTAFGGVITVYRPQYLCMHAGDHTPSLPTWCCILPILSPLAHVPGPRLLQKKRSSSVASESYSTSQLPPAWLKRCEPHPLNHVILQIL